MRRRAFQSLFFLKKFFSKSFFYKILQESSKNLFVENLVDFSNRFIKNHKIYIGVTRHTKSTTKITLKPCKKSHKVAKTTQRVTKLKQNQNNKAQ